MTRPGLPGRTGRWAASAVHGSSDAGDADGGVRTRRLRLTRATTRPRGFLQDPEPHERDRLKHAGRRMEGQTVKAVKKGEGGATRGWNPATGKPEHWRRTAAGSLRGISCRRPRPVGRRYAGLPAKRRKPGHGFGTVHDFTARLADSARAGRTTRGIFGDLEAGRSPARRRGEGTGKTRRPLQREVSRTPCPSGFRERRASAHEPSGRDLRIAAPGPTGGESRTITFG